ncbi:DUF3811 domain-containing protein [Serratia ureilytica]|uniref:DUF3811 domain-containing protein n=1 Tax=Serratia ureilytica TaxID=300181 RepID=UPI001AA14FB9|nr:DUF3811 domain-containing protein [Serratia ureilytica]MBO1811418.1 DUF3811 domain-containing protein [Serratia ureilytica]
MSRLKKIVQGNDLTDYEQFALQALIDKAERDAGGQLSTEDLHAVVLDYLSSIDRESRKQRKARACAKMGRVRQQNAEADGKVFNWQPSSSARHLRHRS